MFKRLSIVTGKFDVDVVGSGGGGDDVTVEREIELLLKSVKTVGVDVEDDFGDDDVGD